MKIRDLMTEKVIYVEVPSDRREALRKMVKEGISGLPVVDRHTGKLVGIITRKDIFRRPDEEQLALIMTPDPITISPDATPGMAARLMLEHGIRRLPVIEKDRLVGIVTPTDLMPVIEEEGKGVVADYMGDRCVPIYQETPLNVMAKIIHASQVYALPVLGEEGRLVGIATDGDMFRKGIVDEEVVMSDLGIGADEDGWTWEGLRYVMKLYYISSKITLPSIPVKEIMVKDVKTVYRETPISKAARLMRLHNIGQLPVIEPDGYLGGMVFSTDLLKWFLTEER